MLQIWIFIVSFVVKSYLHGVHFQLYVTITTPCLVVYLDCESPDILICYAILTCSCVQRGYWIWGQPTVKKNSTRAITDVDI